MTTIEVAHADRIGIPVTASTLYKWYRSGLYPEIFVQQNGRKCIRLGVFWEMLRSGKFASVPPDAQMREPIKAGRRRLECLDCGFVTTASWQWIRRHNNPKCAICSGKVSVSMMPSFAEVVQAPCGPIRQCRVGRTIPRCEYYYTCPEYETCLNITASKDWVGWERVPA